MGYGKMWFGTSGKYFLMKKVSGINSMGDLVNRAKKEWNTNKKLREEVRKYMKEHFPMATKISVGLGFQSSYVNPMRYPISFDIRKDRL